MRIFITSFLLIIFNSSHAQSLFVNTYGTPSAEERAFDMVVMDDGSIITFGDRYETSTFERTGHLLKVDADGNEQWNRQLSSNDEIYGAAICKLPNGNVLVSGYDHDVTNVEFGLLVAEYNGSNGLSVYQKTHVFGRSTAAVDIVPMQDNGAIILSTYETGSSFKTNMLCRINSSGDTLWSKRIDEYPDDETPGGLTLVSDGLVITGSVHEGSSDNVFLIKTDMSGNVQWEQTYASSGIEFANGIVAIPGGGFYVAGITNAIGNGGLDMLAMRLDASGQLIWDRGFGSGSNDLGYGVDVMSDGGAIFVGSAHRSDTTNFRDLFLVRTDGNGDTLWTRHYGNIGADSGYEVKVDGSYIVAAGKSDVGSSEDVMVVRTDLNGNATVGISELESQPFWNIYPNPFTDRVTIDPGQRLTGPVTLRLSDIMGRVIMETAITEKTTIDLTLIDAGLYSVIIGQENRSSSKRLQKVY